MLKKGKADQFLMGADSSDEDSDEGDKTVVLSAKDKRFVEMDAAIQNIKNATKGEGAANDWVVAASGRFPYLVDEQCTDQTELDKLLRFITRHQTSMVSSPIPPAGHIPPQFLQTIVDLDAGVTKTVAAEKSATKKMTGAKAKAVTGLKQTIKKKNKEFEMVLSTFKEVRLALSDSECI